MISMAITETNHIQIVFPNRAIDINVPRILQQTGATTPQELEDALRQILLVQNPERGGRLLEIHVHSLDPLEVACATFSRAWTTPDVDRIVAENPDATTEELKQLVLADTREVDVVNPDWWHVERGTVSDGTEPVKGKKNA